jgi:hypothetical protein
MTLGQIVGYCATRIEQKANQLIGGVADRFKVHIPV